MHVFPCRLGAAMEPATFRRSSGRIRVAAGLDGVRFHDIRHTRVALLSDFGVSPCIVREIVGHSGHRLTMVERSSCAASMTTRGLSWALTYCCGPPPTCLRGAPSACQASNTLGYESAAAARGRPKVDHEGAGAADGLDTASPSVALPGEDERPLVPPAASEGHHRLLPSRPRAPRPPCARPLGTAAYGFHARTVTNLALWVARDCGRPPLIITFSSSAPLISTGVGRSSRGKCDPTTRRPRRFGCGHHLCDGLTGVACMAAPFRIGG